MNPRILKKLTKKASLIIDCLDIQSPADKVIVKYGDNVECHLKIDRKHLERTRGKPNDWGYFQQLDGTIGYGGTVGYYEPEWEDSDAYTILRQWVIDSYTQWDEWDCDSGEHPISNCPKKVYANPHTILKIARLEVAARYSGIKVKK